MSTNNIDYEKKKQQLFCGWNHSIILRSDYQLLVAGFNDSGQLGLSNNQNQRKFIKNDFFIKKGIKIKNVICGGNHTYFITMKNEVYCSGWNKYGQLGLGHFKESVYPPVKHTFFDGKNDFKIYCGSNSTYVLYKGNIWSFGSNNSGQLGLGRLKEQNINTPKLIKIKEEIVELFTSFYSSHLFFKVKKDDRIFCNGHNLTGELGLNHEKNIFSPIEWKSTLFNVKDIKIIYTGDFNSFYLTKNNQLFGSGSNSYGALGIGKSYRQLEDSLIPMKIELNKLVDDFKDEKIISLNCGRWFSLIQTEKGNIFAFGYNEYYQLGGNGNNKDLLKPKKTFKNLKIIESNCGGYHSLVMTKNEKIFSVGRNEYGQTGLGSKEKKIKKVTEAAEKISHFWK